MKITNYLHEHKTVPAKFMYKFKRKKNSFDEVVLGKDNCVYMHR